MSCCSLVIIRTSFNVFFLSSQSLDTSLMPSSVWLPQIDGLSSFFAGKEFKRSDGGEGPTRSTSLLIFDGLQARIPPPVPLHPVK